MSNLRFHCLIDSYLCDIAPFESYIEKGTIDSGLILISFDETEVDIIRTLFKDNVHNGQEAYLDKIQVVGTDDYLYIMSQTSLEKKEKMPQNLETCC